MQIIELNKQSNYLEEAITIFWNQWGNEKNFPFYEDCIRHSTTTNDPIPRFYIAVENNHIIGTYALLRNDLNSRQDLYPWFACLYVTEVNRGREIGSKLLNHALTETAMKGYPKLYLTTDLEGYYEKYGWIHSGYVYGIFGDSIKLYEKLTNVKSI
ncbi:GNAT family N-acetyltransferase [Salirhabdus sp. Marseille-P4669]|uniref:GNAT family N-acetyltransferase n=1 Tax=Salirhabdus sp. Marseille-P4669 TaxID=2042310 RepID=UPI000C7B49D0|nr:GNAT family N-acetyltransferase [Salirhabdus sp. Marseille-P4669]